MLHTHANFVSYNHPLKDADVVFAGVPFVSTATSKALPYGPIMVRHALERTEDFIPEINENLFEKLKICDIGDIEIIPGSFEQTAERIKETIAHVMEESKPKFWIFIGGDHSVSLPIVQTLKPNTIVMLDAHSDLSSEEEGYSKFNHATWARHAAEGAQIILAGVRSWSRSGWAFAQANKSKIKVVEPHEIANLNLQQPVHISLDIDVLDPAFISDTGYPEGTLTPADILHVADSIKASSLDIVEIADDKLPSKSAFFAAKFIKHCLAWSLLGAKMQM